mmetsp:Transcript_9122/g.26166  ORF Transcript_9122/g.26166 Transcript_9122/m.26166 type:complete len:279 (-) Transcript_9122:174-1010(-)
MSGLVVRGGLRSLPNRSSRVGRFHQRSVRSLRLASNSAILAAATPEDTCTLWRNMKRKKPLVQCITNYVSMDLAANLLLAAGASPAMVHSADEVEEFCSISSGLLVNLGTLSSEWIAAMKLAVNKANSTDTPWVLDPVGAGATQYRTKACVDILQMRPTVLRGNASEILAMAGAAGSGKGVDSMVSSDNALEAAKAIARDYGCVVAVSGAIDYVTDGSRVLAVKNGVPMLCDITATGCSVTALIAALVAANTDDPLHATAAALAVFGWAAPRRAPCPF